MLFIVPTLSEKFIPLPAGSIFTSEFHEGAKL